MESVFHAAKGTSVELYIKLNPIFFPFARWTVYWLALADCHTNEDQWEASSLIVHLIIKMIFIVLGL